MAGKRLRDPHRLAAGEKRKSFTDRRSRDRKLDRSHNLCMPISEEEKRRFERQIRALQSIETDDPGTPEQRRRMLAVINYLRAIAGEPLLPEDDNEDFPELGFFERAKRIRRVRDGNGRS